MPCSKTPAAAFSASAAICAEWAFAMTRVSILAVALLILVAHAGAYYFGANFKLLLLTFLIAAWIFVSLIIRTQLRKLTQTFSNADESLQSEILNGMGGLREEFLGKATGALRNDWRWRLAWAPTAVLFIFGLPLLYDMSVGYPLTLDSPFTFVHLMLAFCGLGIYFAVRTWLIDHYRCPGCHGAAKQASGESLLFFCGRCGVLWNTGDRAGFRLWPKR
jgi:hypothetical protein